MRYASPSPSPRLPWWIWLLLPVVLLGTLFFVGLLLILVLLAIGLALVMKGLQSLEEWRFRRRMKAQDRFIAWDDLVPSLSRGEGTLILQQGRLRPVRAWWTPDDVLSLAPCPPPSWEEMALLGIRPESPREFVAWCQWRYLDEANGSARLTRPPVNRPGLFLGAYLEQTFPRMSTVETVSCPDPSRG